MQLQSSTVFKLAALAIAVTMAHGVALAQKKEPATPVQQNSVTTVDTLVKLDNAAALEKAKADAIKNGLLKPEAKSGAGGPVVKPVEPPPVVRVLSISGVREDLSAGLTVNGQSYPNLNIGASVRGCVVAEIKDRCVVLKPAPAETVVATASTAPAVAGRAKAKRTSKRTGAASVPATRPEMCPTSCWTGNPVLPTPNMAGAGGGPLPVGMPGGGAPQLPRPPLPAPSPVAVQQGGGTAGSSASSFN